MGRPPSGSSSAAALPAALPALARSLWRMARHVATKIYLWHYGIYTIA